MVVQFRPRHKGNNIFLRESFIFAVKTKSYSILYMYGLAQMYSRNLSFSYISEGVICFVVSNGFRAAPVSYLLAPLCNQSEFLKSLNNLLKLFLSRVLLFHLQFHYLLTAYSRTDSISTVNYLIAFGYDDSLYVLFMHGHVQGLSALQ